METEISAYSDYLKQHLSPPRYRHSLGVMQVMQELAEIYHLDQNRATLAGLLHDAAKDFSTRHLLQLANEAKMVFTHPSEKHPTYLHATVGAYWVFKELGIRDKCVLEAISAHSYVGGDASPLPRCLRAADLLAPVREWKGMKKLKYLIYQGRLTEAELLQIGWLLEYLETLHIPIHPEMKTRFQQLSADLEATDAFFERW